MRRDLVADRDRLQNGVEGVGIMPTIPVISAADNFMLGIGSAFPFFFYSVFAGAALWRRS